MCYLLIFCSYDPSLFFTPQEATEKLKLSHPTQPETKPVKVHAPFFRFVVLLPGIMTLLMPNLLFNGVHILGA
jgi:hypothetical protein